MFFELYYDPAKFKYDLIMMIVMMMIMAIIHSYIL